MVFQFGQTSITPAIVPNLFSTEAVINIFKPMFKFAWYTCLILIVGSTVGLIQNRAYIMTVNNTVMT